MKNDKPMFSTSSSPAAASAASKPPESRSPSPKGSKTPNQEAEVEACSTEEKQNTGTLTPKAEVCMSC